MALRLFEPTLANVRTDLRGEYEKQPDGSYALKLIDLDEFVHGLKSALAKSRQENKELRAKYGVTPDGAEALAPFGEIPKAQRPGTQDVRAGLLPRRGTLQRGSGGVN